MEIQVTPAGDSLNIVLVDPDDFRALRVAIARIARDEFANSGLREILCARLGGVEGDSHVLVTVGRLKELAGERAEDDEWLIGFDKMIDYARSKGWVDENCALRAHILWSQ